MRLRESVAFDEPTSVSDGQGGQKDGWTEIYTCRARYQYLRGGETVQQARLQGRQPFVVTIRNRGAAKLINTDHRMRDVRSEEEFNIRTIVPSDNLMYLELTCEKGVPV